MLEQAILNTGIGLMTGIIGSFIGFTCWPWWRRRQIWNGLRVAAEQHTGTGGFWCRVVNDSSFTMGKAVAYITIYYALEDIQDPPVGREAYITRQQHTVILREGQLCWAVQEGGENPMRVDIYSGEKQPLVIGFCVDNIIQIVSEKCQEPARVFLTRKVYQGDLKLVCLDCPAKVFPFTINPEAAQPIAFAA